MILGVSGPYGAGKGEVVAYLAARSFVAYSLSDVLRDELRARGQEESRERMIATGNELRATGGPAALADRLLARLAPDRHYVIDSIRHPAEVEALRRNARGFKLIWVDADPKLRLDRLRSRGRSGDPGSLDALLEQEGRERAGGGENAQQLDAVERLADFRLRNEGSVSMLHRAVAQVLRKVCR